jgi:hypothetical protein
MFKNTLGTYGHTILTFKECGGNTLGTPNPKITIVLKSFF